MFTESEIDISPTATEINVLGMSHCVQSTTSNPELLYPTQQQQNYLPQYQINQYDSTSNPQLTTPAMNIPKSFLNDIKAQISFIQNKVSEINNITKTVSRNCC